MASVSNWILERYDVRRPCVYNGKNGPEKCLFHMFSTESYIVPPSLMVGGHCGGQVSEVVAILEFEDGSVKKVGTDEFKFDDTSFLQWHWRIDDKGEEV